MNIMLKMMKERGLGLLHFKIRMTSHLFILLVILTVLTALLYTLITPLSLQVPPKDIDVLPQKKLKSIQSFVQEGRLSSCVYKMPFFVSGVKEVIEAIKGAEDWSLSSFVKDVLSLSHCFKTVKFSFIPRELNGASHCLAKFSFDQKDSFEWSGSFPGRIRLHPIGLTRSFFLFCSAVCFPCCAVLILSFFMKAFSYKKKKEPLTCNLMVATVGTFQLCHGLLFCHLVF